MLMAHRLRCGWFLSFLFLLSLPSLPQQKVIKGTVLSATPQALTVQVEGKPVNIKIDPGCSFFIYGRRMLGIVVPVGQGVVVVAEGRPDGSLVAVSVSDEATEARCKDELREGTVATLVSADPEAGTLTLRVKYGWNISCVLDRDAIVLKGGKPATLKDFKPGGAVGVTARTRRGKWVVEALADPITHYLLVVRGGRMGKVEGIDASKGIVAIGAAGRVYKVRPTERTWIVVGGRLSDLKGLKPGMEVLTARIYTRGGISYTRAIVEAKSAVVLPPEVLLLLRSEPKVRRGRPIVGRLSSVEEEKAVVKDILRGEVLLRLSERTKFFKAGRAVKPSDFKAGEMVVAVPSGTRGETVYCGLLCDLKSFEAVSERLRAEEAD
ncbi:MAG TPA: hypothetical protein EYP65_05460 [Armatimonadetes bacterium]|nr:hypothetical protein [Armatimonadota bacterium]